jgi:hypothetical protein
MILKDKVLINVTERNVSYFKDKGYSAKINEKLLINVSDLKRYSRVKIKIKCSCCGEEKDMTYTKYMDNVERQGFYTCRKCSSIKKKITFKNNYGVDNPMKDENIKKKGKETKKNKYGDENYNNQEKHKETNLKKYGVEHHLQNEKILDKQRKTNLERYGKPHTVMVDDIIKKSKITKKERYGDEFYHNIDKMIKSKLEHYNFNIKPINKKEFECDCDQGHEHTYIINKNLLYYRINKKTTICTICNEISNISEDEKLILDFIEKNYNGEIITNSKSIISPYELDIYLPDLNLAFEFNGVYWHNELNRPSDYHKIKSDLCDDKGIQLIHIYEDDWTYKRNIIESMILNKLGKTDNKIYARKTEIKEINDNKLIRYFLNENHLQGFIGSSIKLGLFYNNELVSLMTFGKKRIFMKSLRKDGFEILRFCNKLNTNVIGGASKLFKYFINKYKPNEVISYADRSYSNGNLYEHLGFNLEHVSPPNYYYVINNLKYHRYLFRKDVLVKEGYDSNKTEHEIMLERKIYRIYNSGNYKYIYTNN